MDQLDTLVDLLPKEISNSLRAMLKTDDLSEKKTHSEIVLNLCKSLGVFIGAMDMVGMDYDDDSDLLFEEVPLELHKPKKTTRRKTKRSNKDDLPF